MAWKEMLVMMITTYVIRLSPFVLFRKKIKNRFIQSLLYYVPYVVLSAMTFPAILFSTSSKISALLGTGVAIVLAYEEKSLIVVALGAAIGAWFGGLF